MGDVAYNASDLRNFGRALRKVSRDGYKQYRRALKESTAEVVEEARSMAKGKGVAETIKPFAAGALIGVQVGKEGSVGKAFEVGNASSDKSIFDAVKGGAFGHPVYGKGWVTGQEMHPAVSRAAIGGQKQMIGNLLKGVNRAFEDVRLEME